MVIPLRLLSRFVTREFPLTGNTISFPESSFPLTSGSGYERLWDKAFSDNRILVIPVELRRREVYFKLDSSSESAYSSTFHKAVEFP